MKLSKKNKMIVAAVCAVLVVAVVVTAVCAPRTGRKAVDIWSPYDEFDIKQVASVEKEEGKPFKIMLMTDLQLWTDLIDNAKVFDLMDKLVEEEKPDLIVLPGDNVSGIATDLLTRQFVAKMESYKIPWAPVFGNHDAEGNATLEWQADRFEEAEYCLFSRGPSNLYGVGNYAVNITENGEVVQTLVLLDNGRYIEYDNGEQDEVYMGYEQIAWYEWLIENTEKAAGKKVPSMVFSHFAPPEMVEAVEELCELKDGKYCVPEEYGYGYLKYLPCASPVNSGFFDKVKELGSTTHLFFGHDHENYASIKYEGITMTYGLKTGCSPKFWNDAEMYGATTIILDGGKIEIKNNEKPL